MTSGKRGPNIPCQAVPACPPGTVTAVKRTFVDLFSGCGGMTLGFTQTGRFIPVGAVESDPYAAATYEANFGAGHMQNSLIEEVKELPHADVLVGGPPCQGFSTLNRGRETVSSRSLWAEYLRALELVQPKMFVMENVPQLLDSVEFRTFKALAEVNYVVEHRVLNTADFGVPQRRRRAIVIGSRVGPIGWPQETHTSASKPALGREPWVTFREAVEELSLVPDGDRWHRPRNSRPETVLRYSAVPHDGGNRFDMQTVLDSRDLGHLVPPCWRRKPSGTADVGGRLWWDRPSTTIRCEFYKPEKGRYLHPSEDRPITVREAARLMSFPDTFVLPDDQTLTAIGRQVGNAVPPRFARAVADSIEAALSGASTARDSSGDHVAVEGQELLVGTAS